jgi:SNF2 family DNA or RNA helicase
MKKLFDYQQKIVDECKKSNALFMKMGTGKTITSLRIAEKWQCEKLLVVCLKSKIQDWIDEIEEETYFTKGEYMVINFESVWRNTKAIDFTNSKTMIIVDESHKIKNPKSKVSQYMRWLAKLTRYKLVLTGTPQNEEYYDYWMQMGFIDSPLYSIPLKQFEEYYVNFILDYQQGHYFKRIESYNNTEKLKEAINEKAFYKEYESSYGNPLEIYEKLDTPSYYKTFMKEKVYDDVVADNDISLRIYLRQCCSGFIRNHKLEKNPKEKWLSDFLEITNDRVVIFVNYNMEIDIIKNLCKELKRPYSIYNGEIKDLTDFKNNENGIAIVNYASGATGINDLCISNIGIFFSPPDGDYILFSQAKSRLDRIGQQKQPIFYFLQCQKTIEIPIYNSFKLGDSFTNEMYLNWLYSEKS